MTSSHYQAERVSQLAHQILLHKQLYYAGRPAISDIEYDKIEDELRKIAPDHPVLSYVGSEASNIGHKVKHDIPMLSLQKCYNERELFAWAQEHTLVGLWKLDGNSLALCYVRGKLQLAKTRGNGRIGEDVTDKARWVSAIIPDLGIDVDVEIRGELYCPLIKFGELSQEMSILNLERPTNPRNIVAGILGRKNHGELARYFGFCAFDVISQDTRLQFSTEWDKISWLKNIGFLLPEPCLLRSHDAISGYLVKVREQMERSDVALDGAVFCYNDLGLHEELGTTSHHPRYKMSFKWQGDTAVVTIRKIVWATSRFGIVTPVAIIDPVWLSGAKITNITLHNGLNVINNNLKVGDQIEIVRSGEVIPKFLRVVLGGPVEDEYVPVKVCPSCSHPIEFDGVRFKCENRAECSAQNLGLILNWIRSMEIDDLSEKRLEKMVEMGLVHSLVDLYRLTLDDLLMLPATKERMAKKLLTNIAASRSRPLAQFLNGLSIEGAGLNTFEKLIMHYPSIEELMKVTAEELCAIDGFAIKSATQIVNGLKERRFLIQELLAIGVTPIVERIAQGTDGELKSPIMGKHIVITGKLSMPRAELEKKIKQQGGHVVASISKNTFALVSNDQESGSSKMKKALDCGIRVMNEQQFLELLSR